MQEASDESGALSDAPHTGTPLPSLPVMQDPGYDLAEGALWLFSGGEIPPGCSDHTRTGHGTQHNRVAMVTVGPSQCP